MQRLRYFWSALPLWSKLQYLVLAAFLAYTFVSIDLNPRKQAFGLKLWQVTLPMICGTILLGRLLLPVMMWNPRRAEQALTGFGLLIFALWVFKRALNLRLVITYLGLMGGLWLDASCWFWFLSEVRRREAELMDQLAGQTAEASEEDCVDEQEDE